MTKAILWFAVTVLAFFPSGPLAAWLLTDVWHVVGPDNVLAGGSLGFGGVLVGGAIGLVFLLRALDRIDGGSRP